MGLEVEPLNFQQNHSDIGTPDSGPVCYQEHNPAGEILQLEVGSSGSGDGCLPPTVGRTALCQHPMAANTTDSVRGEDPKSHNNLGGSSVEVPGVVPVILSLLFDHPQAIPPLASNILQIHQIPPPIRGQDIQLAAWPISGDPTKQANYQRTLQDSLWPPGVRSHNLPTTHSFRNGSAGVLHGAEIPLWDLWET